MLTKIFDITSEDPVPGLRKGNLKALKEMIRSTWMSKMQNPPPPTASLRKLVQVLKDKTSFALTRVWTVKNEFTTTVQEAFAKHHKLPDTDRVWVYHGTTAASAIKIGRDGFNLALGEGKVWGVGIYTGTTIRTAYPYAKPQKQDSVFGSATDAENYWQTVVICDLVEGNKQMGTLNQKDYGTDHKGQRVHTLTNDKGNFRCCLPDQLNPLFVVQFYLDTSKTNLHIIPWALEPANSQLKRIDEAKIQLDKWCKNLYQHLLALHDNYWLGWQDFRDLKEVMEECFRSVNRWDDFQPLMCKLGVGLAAEEFKEGERLLETLRGIFPMAHIERYNAFLDRLEKAEKALQQEEAAAAAAEKAAAATAADAKKAAAATASGAAAKKAAAPTASGAAAKTAASYEDLKYYRLLEVQDRVRVTFVYADTKQLYGREGTVVRIVVEKKEKGEGPKKQQNNRYWALVKLDVKTDDPEDEKKVKDCLKNSAANKADYVWKKEFEEIHGPLLRVPWNGVQLLATKRPADDVPEGSAASKAPRP